MNPSANGWIKKLIKSLQNTAHSTSIVELYNGLRLCGYIYGSNTGVVNNCMEKGDLSSEEICKINHTIALYISNNETQDPSSFLDNAISFYSKVNAYRTSFLSDILGKKEDEALLESIIHKRIQIDDNLIDKSFNYFITNALLFIDILAFRDFLATGNVSEKDIKQKEAIIETIVLNTLNAKVDKTEYDSSLINFFEQSLRYQKEVKLGYLEAIALLKTDLDKQYIFDLACMSTWSDKTIDDKERHFLIQLGKDLKIEQDMVGHSISVMHNFFTKHQKDIVLLGSKNIVKTFYDNSSKMVSKLISRNSKRLQKELSQSKELMFLISQSTIRELTIEEQKQVQEQLLDIFKSIPSLAIFILPGGAILLPLVIKFIPKLLPSSFDDNRIEGK